MRKKTQYIVVNEIYKTIYCGYPQKRAWKNLTTAEGGALLKKWDELPDFMKTEEVKPYYEVLKRKWLGLFFKRAVDFVGGLVLLVLLAIPMAVIAVMIKLDSEGPVFYRQERVTTYGKHFKIHKFRTMVSNADKIGTTVTVGNDSRITKIGAKLRGCRLDELPQVLDLISGDMSFVGTRPEAVKYVEKYKPEYMATLLLPAGITSEAMLLPWHILQRYWDSKAALLPEE